MEQFGFFDADRRLAAITAKGVPLEMIARVVPLARVARVWKVSRASVYRSLKETQPNTIARRPGPVGACSDAELADHIRRQIAASRLHGEGYRKLWARRLPLARTSVIAGRR